jgi:hypothetical protein
MINPARPAGRTLRSALCSHKCARSCASPASRAATGEAPSDRLGTSEQGWDDRLCPPTVALGHEPRDGSALFRPALGRTCRGSALLGFVGADAATLAETMAARAASSAGERSVRATPAVTR